MSKPVHPIRKLVRACRDHHVRRIVKPLLDALEYAPHAVGHGEYCQGCNADIRRERLITAWKAPL